ncbi:hypothetical protein GYMLUDRAFT_238954 [Collybiopsis luxurians FD-317 M1]|nr:hypothetical protein GYMLUDRAFT_238954 [Collybiopsis luxurians FD-317 M1]
MTSRKRKATELESLLTSASAMNSNITGFHVTRSRREFSLASSCSDYMVDINIKNLLTNAYQCSDEAWDNGLTDAIKDMPTSTAISLSPAVTSSSAAIAPVFNPLSNLLTPTQPTYPLPICPYIGNPDHDAAQWKRHKAHHRDCEKQRAKQYQRQLDTSSTLKQVALSKIKVTEGNAVLVTSPTRWSQGWTGPKPLIHPKILSVSDVFCYSSLTLVKSNPYVN